MLSGFKNIILQIANDFLSQMWGLFLERLGKLNTECVQGYSIMIAIMLAKDGECESFWLNVG